MRPALSKKDLLVTVEVSIPEGSEQETIKEVSHDAKYDSALDALANEVEGLGYTDFDFEFVETPYDTNRGKLIAKGSFQGPSPFGEESRAPEDVSDYSFSLLEDEKTNATVIEIKHEAALLATYEIKGSGIELLDGELPHV